VRAGLVGDDAKNALSRTQPLGVVKPVSRHAFAPSEMATRGTLTGKDLTDRAECEGCHHDVAAVFSSSIHALGSFTDPIYRVALERFRDNIGKKPSRFCGGCHDMALMVDGGMDVPVEPNDPRAHAGITCRVCHSIADAHVDGNASYELTAEPFPAPVEGDPASLAKHKARAALPALRTNALCSSCHRAYLHEGTGNAHFLVGQDDVTPWQQSAYAGSAVHFLDEDVEVQDCRGCHMPRVRAERNDPAAKNGTIASHQFLGAHTWLAAMRRDEKTLAQVRSMLEGVVSMDIGAVVSGDGKRTLPADGAPVKPGERVVVDVVMRNEKVGHRFPGGAADAQDTWIEVDVRDSKNALVAEAGMQHERTGDDPTAHVLRALVVSDDGTPRLERQTEQFRAAAFNHTIPARGAQVVEYAFDVPNDVALPLRVHARLQHRTRGLPLQRAACEESRSARGIAYRKAAEDLDACVTQPITTVAETEAWIGPGSPSVPLDRPELPLWRRLFNHGLGFVGALQERRDEAVPSFVAALSALEGSSDPRPKAAVTAALAMLAGRQGRTEEALRWIDGLTKLAPTHPALPYLRGEALSQVWRFEQAAGHLGDAVQRAPRDPSVWVMLATARASAGWASEALDAARRGLVFQPRDHDLLRIQALSLEALGCALERSPVHVHQMRSAVRQPKP
jgi:tetratricopeptide (TPR) repeat protein